jgi:PAS domain-containing protein
MTVNGPIELQSLGSSSALVDQALASGRDSASLLAAIVDSSVDAILGKTLDGLITNWNLGAKQTYAYKASEVTGRHISLLFAPDALDDALARSAHGGLVNAIGNRS